MKMMRGKALLIAWGQELQEDFGGSTGAELCEKKGGKISS